MASLRHIKSFVWRVLIILWVPFALSADITLLSLETLGMRPPASTRLALFIAHVLPLSVAAFSVVEGSAAATAAALFFTSYVECQEVIVLKMHFCINVTSVMVNFCRAVAGLCMCLIISIILLGRALFACVTVCPLISCFSVVLIVSGVVSHSLAGEP